jgi:DNA-binding NtrC family response regulator
MKKILIVDDEENVLLLLSRALRTNSVEVITTSRIEEAKYAIRSTFFDLVIADIRLNGVVGREGFELLEYIQEKSPGTRVIIMTAYGSRETEKEAYEKGAYFYFDKPINLWVLNGRLKDIGIQNDILS